MSSKAQRWYEAQQAVQRSFKVSEGTSANVALIPNAGPHLELVMEHATVMPTADQALAFARWIIAEFGDEEEAG